MADVSHEPAVGTFELAGDLSPAGDQPRAIDRLVSGLAAGAKGQVLMGVTGSGKTYTMAQVIARTNRPTLVLSHNKTLAAQLFREFKELFPTNAVEYFVSYYDYYMPEAYIPSTDTYIEKDTSINDELDKMRIAATKHLLQRRDTIIVASVSCIYGIGNPVAFREMVCHVEEGQRIRRDDLLRHLVEMLYQRGDHDFTRGTFRVRGDVVDVFPAYEERTALRITLFGDEIESIAEIDALTGKRGRRLRAEAIFPASHYVTTRGRLEAAMDTIAIELEERCRELANLGKTHEAARLRQRTMFDLEMMHEMGTCQGIENYSRHLSGRAPGEPPPTLINYFPRDFLFFVDESHVTLPQVGAMYRGDRVRKQTLVDYGFRLPSALDNRPLKREEFEALIGQTIYVSATPAERELELSGGLVVEQIVRPTGLLDPPVEVRRATGQVDDLLGEINKVAERGERVLVTTLTKRFSEELVNHYADLGVRVRYLHSDIDAIERTQILHGLRAGEFDVLIGINLLREGLDLPEVALVAILDADKEGFLRSATALIQTCGRAARNVGGRVIMYADVVTDSMKKCLDETERRRALQAEHNAAHGIEPRGIVKKLGKILETSYYDKDPDEAMFEGRKGQGAERYTQSRRQRSASTANKHREKKGMPDAKWPANEGTPEQAEELMRGKAMKAGTGKAKAAPGAKGAAAGGAAVGGAAGGGAPADSPHDEAAASASRGGGALADDGSWFAGEELMVGEAEAAFVKDPRKLAREIERLRKEMKKAAGDLDFETAAQLRDRLFRLEKLVLIDLA